MESGGEFFLATNLAGHCAIGSSSRCLLVDQVARIMAFDIRGGLDAHRDDTETHAWTCVMFQSL